VISKEASFEVQEERLTELAADSTISLAKIRAKIDQATPSESRAKRKNPITPSDSCRVYINRPINSTLVGTKKVPT